MSSTARPFGVKVIVVLQVLLGVVALLGGLAVFFSSSVLSQILLRMRPGDLVLGLALALLAVVDLALSIGLWSGRRWAWVAALGLAVFGIGSYVILMFLRPRISELFSLILDLVVVYYLIQPSVQNYFGRMSTKAPMSVGA